MNEPQENICQCGHEKDQHHHKLGCQYRPVVVRNDLCPCTSFRPIPSQPSLKGSQHTNGCNPLSCSPDCPSLKSPEDKIAVDFQQEPWEDDEYIITLKGKGPVGGTVSKRDAEIIMRWWKTAAKETNGLAQALHDTEQAAEARGRQQNQDAFTNKWIQDAKAEAIAECIEVIKKMKLGKPRLPKLHPEYQRAVEDNEIHDETLQMILARLSKE